MVVRIANHVVSKFNIIDFFSCFKDVLVKACLPN